MNVSGRQPFGVLSGTTMVVVNVTAEKCSPADSAALTVGGRVAYNGSVWKVVGVYFARDPERGGEKRLDASAAHARTKHVILRSLPFAPDILRGLGVSRE